MSDEQHTLRFRVPFEHSPPTVGELLARAWPEANAEQREQALAEEMVRINEVIVGDPAAEPGAGAQVTAEVSLEGVRYGMPDASELARGEDWVVVDKPVGMPGRPVADDPMHPILFLADELGLDREIFTPVWSTPPTGGRP